MFSPKHRADRLSECAFVIPPWLIAATSAVLGAAGWALVEWLAPSTSQWSFPARLVLLTGVGVGLLYLVLGLLYLRLWQRNRTRRAFGVLWDVRNQPVCPKCQGTLAKNDGSSWRCGACQSLFGLYDETASAGHFYIWDAARLMSERRVWWSAGWGKWKDHIKKG